ncbi:MAG: DUF2339 domain-containing protein [Treponema pedis]
MLIKLAVNGRKIKILENEIKKLKVLYRQFSSDLGNAAYNEPAACNTREENEKLSANKRTAFENDKSKVSYEVNSFYMGKENSEPEKRRIAKKSKASSFFKNLFSIESIISKLGIILLLIGIGYIFKLGYNNGYITENVALMAGCAGGALLVSLSLYVNGKKRIILSQVLLGGGIAVFYITAYAAYLHYGILGDVWAFVFLSIITASAYSLSMTTSYPAIAIIALSGSLIIPFAVGLNFLGLTGFGFYVFAVSVFSSIIYFFKRWRILQFSSVVSLFIALSILVIKFNFNIAEARMFLTLICVLWTINILPDFIFHLCGSEKHSDKIYSVFAAVINYVFTIFFVFKLSNYNPVPNGIAYFTAALVYTATAYISINKNRLSNLSYTYIALALTSVYCGILDCLSFSIQPAAVLAVSLFLYWLWRKNPENKLMLPVHIMFAAGYTAALINLLWNFYSVSFSRLFFQSLLYFVPMFLSVPFQKEKSKKLFQTFVLQVYIFIISLLHIYNSVKPNNFFIFGYDISKYMILIFAAVTVLLFGLYNLLHYKTKNIFYEQSLYACPISVIFFLLLDINRLNFYFQYNNLTLSVILQFMIALGVILISLFKDKTSLNKFMYLFSFYFIVLKFFLFDVFKITGDVRYGILLSVLFILIIDKFYKFKTNEVLKTLKISKIAALFLIPVYYVFFYFIGIKEEEGINLFSVLLNICNSLIFLKIILEFKINKIFYFTSGTVIFVFFSVIDIYLPLRNGGVLTLLWAFYSISVFVFYLVRADKNMVYTALVLIVIVAAKLIFIDFYTISIFFKVISSLIFGSALLGVSYLIPPLIKRITKQENEKED